MKKLAVVVALGFLALPTLAGAEAAQVPTDSSQCEVSVVDAEILGAPAEVPDATELTSLSFGTGATAASLPSCGVLDGTACTSAGASIRCMWAPYEPGRCGCRADKGMTWWCG
jgi:hypothetical protein